jgi:hypothetical protein
MNETNPPTGAFVDFPANQPPRPAQPTNPASEPPRADQAPIQAAEVARVAAEAEANRRRVEADRNAVEERSRQADRIAAERPTPEQVAGKYEDFGRETIPITERGSTARVPAPGEPDRGAELAHKRAEEAQQAASKATANAADKRIKDVVRTPEETMRANLEAPGHQIGYAIEGDLVRDDCGLFQCGIDAHGRVWRIEDGGDGKRLVLAGWLNT